MSLKINLINPAEDNPSAAAEVKEMSSAALPQSNHPSTDTFEENLQYLIFLYPDKILFCMKDASLILGQSYEYVRLKIREGKIAHKSYGARKMIHRLEMARLITEGIKCL